MKPAFGFGRVGKGVGLGKAGAGGMKLGKARAERNERGSFAVR